MNTRILARLETLEKIRPSKASIAYRIGVLKSLPRDFVGERHIALVERGEVRQKVEWCKFEERPGKAPATQHDGIPTIYLSELEMLY
jgi:hypothetical protein